MKHPGARPRYLLETPFCTIRWDEQRAFLWFVRSEQPYRSAGEIAREGLLVHRALEKAGRPRLLVDLRAVPPLSDRGLVTSMATFRRKLFGGKERKAILVKTPIGVLQTQRHLREDNVAADVFLDENEALAFIGAGLTRRARWIEESVSHW